MEDKLKIYERVNKAESLEELATVIENLADDYGKIQGRTRHFDAKKMANICRNYNLRIHNALTREYGIRQQAMYILFYTD